MSKLSNVKNLIVEKRLFRKRLSISIGIVIVLTLILLSRLVDLQIIQHKTYATLSKNNYIALRPIEPNRGLIFDRNGVLLAENVPVFSLALIPESIKNLEETLLELEQIIKISPTELKQFYVNLKRQPNFDPVVLKVKLTEKELAKFYVNQYRFPGVIIKNQMIRKYPLGDILENVVGYTGRFTSAELSKVDPVNYSASNFIGKAGIEKYYEKELHGKIGYEEIETDATGRSIRTIKKIPPTPGDDLYLTVDSKLQKVAMDALGKECGAVVAIQPKTGEVLVLASSPSFNPNLFVKGISQKEYKKLQDSKNTPMFDRAVSGQFPIASTIKPFLALEALSLHIITPNYTIFDPGWFKLPNTKHVYRDWKKGGHGYVNLTKAIIVSCDTYFYNLAVKLGIQRIDDILNRFGFGRKTGIDTTGEVSGIVPSPKWKMHTLGIAWYTGDTVISGIGQGFVLATPIQLAVAAATLANRGQRLEPTLLLKTKLGDGKIINQKPIFKDPVMIENKKIWNIVIEAMQKVVTSTNPWGTARIRFGTDEKYTVAAKTGTAQVFSNHNRDEDALGNTKIPKKLRNHSLFIAFAPIKNPKIAIAVIVEHSPIAGTVARKVLDYYLLKENEKDEKIPSKT